MSEFTEGWMKTMQKSKSLEELLKLAEITKRPTPDAAKILGKDFTTIIGALINKETRNIAAITG